MTINKTVKRWYYVVRLKNSTDLFDNSGYKGSSMYIDFGKKCNVVGYPNNRIVEFVWRKDIDEGVAYNRDCNGDYGLGRNEDEILGIIPVGEIEGIVRREEEVEIQVDVGYDIKG